MSHIEAMKLALEALEKLSDAADGFSVSGVYFNEELWAKECLSKAYDSIDALSQAIAEAEKQEQGSTTCDKPVAWMHVQGGYEEPSFRQLNDHELGHGLEQYPLYTTPPSMKCEGPQQRRWVGLTTKDQKEIERQSVYVEGAIRMTEAKLKEKNT
jgi:hypothetical protein